MAKHTPGPWNYKAKLSSSENHWGFNIYGKHWVAEVSPCDQFGIEGEANAKLIAAAPELLAALKRILDVEPDYGKANRLGQIELIAEQAIAKATEGGNDAKDTS